MSTKAFRFSGGLSLFELAMAAPGGRQCKSTAAAALRQFALIIPAMLTYPHKVASLMKDKVDPKLGEISDKLKDLEKLKDLGTR